MTLRDLPHPALHALREAHAIHTETGAPALTPRQTFELGLALGAPFAAACAAFFAALRGAPSPTGGIGEVLNAIMQKVSHMDSNLDAIANDWPELKAAITSRLTSDANTIAQLTSELAASATSSTPLSDERAAQIDAEMKATIASLTGVATAVGNAGGPAPVTSDTPTPPAGATGATGSTGATGLAPAQTPAAAPGAAETATTGATGATGPGAPPVGAL